MAHLIVSMGSSGNLACAVSGDKKKVSPDMDPEVGAIKFAERCAAADWLLMKSAYMQGHSVGNPQYGRILWLQLADSSTRKGGCAIVYYSSFDGGIRLMAVQIFAGSAILVDGEISGGMLRGK